MSCIVMKFGGSSLASIERIGVVAQRVAAQRRQVDAVLVVVSAMQHMTDRLLGMAHELSHTPNKRELDMLVTTGERISMSLLAIALNDMGIPSISLTGSQVGIVTNTIHTEARLKEIKAYRIHEEFKAGRIVIVAGFQGISEENEITTLGRGGSDTSAVALAIALNADTCDIYTDVEGIYSCDPRRLKQAKHQSTLSLAEMYAMSALGAKVMHPRSIALAARHQLAITLRSSFSEHKGTRIQEHTIMEQPHVRSIVHQEPVSYLTSALDPVSLNRALVASGIVPLQLFSDAKKSQCIIPIADKTIAQKALQTTHCRDDLALLSLVGMGLLNETKAMQILLKTIASHDTVLIALSTTALSITTLIEKKHLDAITVALHKELEIAGLLE